MSQIPQYFIQDLLSRVDIVELITARIPLQKKGANYLGLCPFHHEKSPSFTVSAIKQFYHCFGCGQHDNAIGFLMAYDHLAFPEAIEELARRVGLEVPQEKGAEPKPQLEPLYALLKRADAFYQNNLRTHPDQLRAVNYLKKRGLTGATAKRFGLGFAPDGWDSLFKHLALKPQDHLLLHNSGLFSGEQSRYDRFRDRILFPIRDKRGRTIGFGGRVIDKGEPKYLNSPETPIFHKGRNLYGLFEAKDLHQSFRRIVVVEGYMDVVMLAQAGIDYAVAALGTATTAEHLKLLKAETQEVIFCFDGDKAGREAASRALKVALPFMTGALDLRFLFLPEGEDPDSLVQKEGKAAFEHRLDHEALSFFDFMLRKLDEDLDLTTPAGKSRWILRFQPYFEALPNGPFRIFVLDAIAKRFGLDPEELEYNIKHSEPLVAQAEENTLRLSLEDQACALLIQNPGLPLPASLEALKAAPQLQELASICRAEGFKTAGEVIEFYRNKPESEWVRALAFHPGVQLLEALQEEWQDVIAKLSQNEDEELSALQNVSRGRALTPEEKERLRHLFSERSAGLRQKGEPKE